MISDIVAGIFLVFDDFFDVGDIVIIDSFRGTISEIGLRSTKLIDWAGNIKAVNNSQITTVTNLSRLATSIIVSFIIDREEDIERVEAILADNLAIISNTLPKVIGEIGYRGVSGLKENGIELAFIVSCKEDDRYQVNRDSLRELYLLMKRNSIKVPFSKIYVHEEKDREIIPASEDDKAKAAAINQANREIPPEEGK